MGNEKRNTRTYKIKDSLYKKAMRRAKKEKYKLANIVEKTIEGYAHGYEIILKNNINQ